LEEYYNKNEINELIKKKNQKTKNKNENEITETLKKLSQKVDQKVDF